MDNLLQLLSTIGAGLLAGVIAALLGAGFSAIYRSLSERTRHNRAIAKELRAEIEQLRAAEEQVRAKLDERHLETIGDFRELVSEEIQAERRASFWPNLWLNIGTNFVTNLFFFVLGVVVTLLTTQHR